MHSTEISRFYDRYIECLNSRRLEDLGEFVNETLINIKRAIGLQDYQDMLAQNFRTYQICILTWILW